MTSMNENSGIDPGADFSESFAVMTAVSEVETNLRRLTAASAGTGPHRSEVAAAIRSLDELLLDHGTEFSPRLRHFLERRSYQKALEFIDGEKDIPSGSCTP